mmetsp:Transcript_30820/g.80405  ORF Transcript_30820/g.80405 Transcript_30820/m.80405 type:complete len:372 (+) Transcript_30820:1729-2844(+)
MTRRASAGTSSFAIRSANLAVSASLSSFSRPSSFLMCLSCSISMYRRWLAEIFSSTCLEISDWSLESSSSFLSSSSVFSIRSVTLSVDSTSCSACASAVESAAPKSASLPDSWISVRSRIICICSLKKGLSLRISLIVCITSIEYAFASDGPASSPSTECSSLASFTLASRIGSDCTTRSSVMRRSPRSSSCTPLAVCVSRVIVASVPTSCTCAGSVTADSSTLRPVSSSGRGRKTPTYGCAEALAAISAAHRPSCVTSHGWKTPGNSGRFENGKTSTGGMKLMFSGSYLTIVLPSSPASAASTAASASRGSTSSASTSSTASAGTAVARFGLPPAAPSPSPSPLPAPSPSMSISSSSSSPPSPAAASPSR